MRVHWLLTFLILNTAHAILVDDLYNSEIKVPSKFISVEQRNALIKQELAKVLQKITGKAKSLSIEDPDQYVSQYSYRDVASKSSTDDQLENNQVMLKIYFDQNLINKTLTENHYPFLAEYRPLTIIWPKSFAAATFSPEQELLQQIIVLGKERGLPIVSPMFDLKEVEILRPDLANEQLISAIKQASKRYAADEIITVECNLKDDELNVIGKSIASDWSFNDQLASFGNIDNQNAETRRANFTRLASSFIDQLTEHLINLYSGANKTIAKEVVLIKISNVINLEDYVQVEKYLQNLAVINAIQATKFQAGEVEFSIVAAGGKQAIKNAISTNNLLQENSTDHNDDNTLLYTYTLQL